MEEIKRFTELTEQKFEELKMALRNISGKSNGNYNNNENSPLLLEILLEIPGSTSEKMTETVMTG